MAVLSNEKFSAWYRAARPRTLTATYAPLGLAAVIAIQDGVFDLVRFVLSLIAALLLQIAANLINEYFDFKRGADEHKTAGQGMIIKNAVLTPRDVLIGAVVDRRRRRADRAVSCSRKAGRCCSGSAWAACWS